MRPDVAYHHWRSLGEFAMADAAILGATGPTGIDLANILHGQRVAVRVVSRSAANLQRAFGEPAFEKVVEDVLDANAAACRPSHDQRCTRSPSQMVRKPTAKSSPRSDRWLAGRIARFDRSRGYTRRSAGGSRDDHRLDCQAPAASVVRRAVVCAGRRAISVRDRSDRSLSACG